MTEIKITVDVSEEEWEQNKSNLEEVDEAEKIGWLTIEGVDTKISILVCCEDK